MQNRITQNDISYYFLNSLSVTFVPLNVLLYRVIQHFIIQKTISSLLFSFLPHLLVFLFVFLVNNKQPTSANKFPLKDAFLISPAGVSIFYHSRPLSGRSYNVPLIKSAYITHNPERYART